MTTHTVMVPLSLERPLTKNEFDELVAWAEGTGAYNGGLVIIADDYATPVLEKLQNDQALSAQEVV